MLPNLVEQVIKQTALVQNIYADLPDLIALNATYEVGQIVYYNDLDTGLVGEVIGDGVTPFTGLVNILLPSSGAVIPTEFTYNTVPTGVITGSYTAGMLLKHGLCPEVTIRFNNVNWPLLLVQFDDNDNPTAFSIDLGCIPDTKTYVKFL